MTYKIGTRVKKVRGENVGRTGVVCAGPATHGFTLSSSVVGSDMYVRFDSAWTNIYGDQFPAGSVGVARSWLYEPILDRHEPCEAEFKESLDALLTKEAASDKVV
jgi:hypothetical protein